MNHDKAINDELVVGVGLAELSGSRTEKRQRFVGITTVFAGGGSYLLGNVSKECAYDSYLDAIRESRLAFYANLRNATTGAREILFASYSMPTDH